MKKDTTTIITEAIASEVEERFKGLNDKLLVQTITDVIRQDGDHRYRPSAMVEKIHSEIVGLVAKRYVDLHYPELVSKINVEAILNGVHLQVTKNVVRGSSGQ